jgi:hypothetical protein
MELVLRFLVFRTMPPAELAAVADMGEFLTDKAVALASDKSFDRSGEEKAFKATFALLSSALGSDSFRRYDVGKRKFVGGFSVSAYEVVALGVGYNYKQLRQDPSDIADIAKAFWTDPEFTRNSGSGVRASTRVPKIVPLGRRKFAV